VKFQIQTTFMHASFRVFLSYCEMWNSRPPYTEVRIPLLSFLPFPDFKTQFNTVDIAVD
jgi:hypothetical protein